MEIDIFSRSGEGAQLSECLPLPHEQSPRFHLLNHRKLGAVLYHCDPSTQLVEDGGWKVEGYTWLHNYFKSVWAACDPFQKGGGEKEKKKKNQRLG